MTQALQVETKNITESVPSSIVVTEAAAQRVWELLEEEGNPNLMLRAYIQGGGCSGFEYGFAFEETINPDDTVVETAIENNVVKLLVDAMSFQYLVGAEIDYKKDLNGERFVIRNPNAQTTCGCGSSFSA